MPRVFSLPPSARYAIAVAGSTLIPVSLFTAHLIGSRETHRWDSPTNDLFALAVSVLGGALFTGLLPFDRKSRILLGIVVLISQAVFLFMYAFIFVCKKYGDCL
jgi:hypothetical protein